MLIDSVDARHSVKDFILQQGFPCAGARTALNKKQITVRLFSSLTDERENPDILDQIYRFIEQFDIRQHMFSSLVLAFDTPDDCSEREYEKMLWNKLQQLHDIDIALHSWDDSVSYNPEKPDFGYSLGGKAFFVICLNPASKRKSRRFHSPAIVLNLHQQFEQLRDEGKFEAFRDHIRKKDAEFNGKPNPMLKNHGTDSEARQYSGRLLEGNWQCPFNFRKDKL